MEEQIEISTHLWFSLERILCVLVYKCFDNFNRICTDASEEVFAHLGIRQNTFEGLWFPVDLPS